MKKSVFYSWVAAGGAAALLAGCQPRLQPENAPATAARALADPGTVRLRHGQYILLATEDALPAGLEADLSRANGKLTLRMDAAGLAGVASDDPDFARKAAKIPGVQLVVPDLMVQWLDPKEQKAEFSAESINPPNAPENDRFFNLQWGHDAINAPEAWQAGYRGAGAKVAVLDGGFDLDHPDLQPNIIYSRSFVPGETAQYRFSDVGSHGSHVAGTIAAADNAFGIIGVAPQAKLLLIKVLSDATGSGAFSWGLQGILDAADQGADVINMSLGGYVPRNGKFLDDNSTPDDPTDDYIVHDAKGVQNLLTLYQRVVRYAGKKGSLIVAAAGNESTNGNADQSQMHIPSAVPGVVSVSATGPLGWGANPATTLDLLAIYSNYGTPDITVAAPGGNFSLPLNTSPCTVAGLTRPCYVFDLVFSVGNNGWFWSAGTSMASPHAAGVAALAAGKAGGNLSADQLAMILQKSADDLGKPGRDPAYGFGRVNAYRAVTQW